MSKRKVFIASDNGTDGEWLGMEIVDEMQDADVVYFSGYRDIDPSTYINNTSSKGAYTYSKIALDNQEIEIYNNARLLNKPIIGTNRGLHLIAIMNGASMITHMQHPANHLIKLYDGTHMKVNSDHHQAVSLIKLRTNSFNVIGHAQEISPFHLNVWDKPVTAFVRDEYGKIIEPEIVLFNEGRALGFQYEPNEFPIGSTALYYSRVLVNLFLNRKLMNAVLLKIPMKRLIDPKFDFTQEDIAELIKLHEKKTQIEIDYAVN